MSHQRQFGLLVFVCVVFTLSLATTPPRGWMKNCGDPKNNFTFYWTPDYITIEQVTTVYANFTAPVDMSTGKACCVGNVSTCPVPVFEKCMDFTCADINQLKEGLCPVKKGDTLSTMEGVKYTIKSSWPIPEDDYIFECNVKNEKDEVFLCAKGPVKVKDPELRMGRFRQAAKPKQDKVDPDRPEQDKLDRRRSEDKQPHSMSQL